MRRPTIILVALALSLSGCNLAAEVESPAPTMARVDQLRSLTSMKSGSIRWP